MARLILYISLVLCGFWLSACGKEKGREMPNMQMTLLPGDSRPMGGQVARQFLEHIYNDGEFGIVDQPFESWLRNENGHSLPRNELYVLISPKVAYWKDEALAMRAYIEAGNTLLMVTDEITADMAETFGLRINNSIEVFFGPSLGDTWLSTTDSVSTAQDLYSYFYTPFNKEIVADSGVVITEKIAWRNPSIPSGVRQKIGRGELIFVTNAAGFSNYFLLSKTNYNYLWDLAAYLPDNPTALYFDEYASRNLLRQPGSTSLFSVLLKIPPLRWAFFILLVTGSLYVLSNLRRKQRVIPVLAPNNNTTVEFVKTIANLYFKKHDNSNIARKVSLYYMEKLRNRYYLPPNIHPADLADIIHMKTGMDLEECREMNFLMQLANRYEHLTDDQMIRLYQLVRKNMAT